MNYLLIFFILTLSTSLAKEPPKNSLYRIIENLDISLRASIKCNDFQDITKSTFNARVISLSSCGSHELSQLELPKLINNSPYAFILLIEINEADYDFQVYQRTLLSLLEPDVRRVLLIDFVNKRDDKEQIKAVRGGDVIVENFLIDSSKLIKDALSRDCGVCIRLLELYNKSFIDRELSACDTAKVKCNSECFRALLNLPFDFNFNSTHLNLYNVLHRSHVEGMKASRVDAQEIDDDFTIEDFLYRKLNRTKCDALTSIAWRLRQFEIFEFLIRADCAYPQNFIDERSNNVNFPRDEKFVMRVENHVAEIEKFHKDIISGNLKAVEAYVNAHDGVLFARGIRNRSALKVAFDSGNLKVLSYLRSRGLFFGSYSELAAYYRKRNQHGNVSKKLIRQYNRMFTKPVRSDVIERLIDRSLVHYDTRVYTNEKIISELRRIFTDLNEFISETLAVAAAASSQLEIIFDFDNSDLDEFDPVMSDTYGAAYSFYDYIIVSGLHLIGSDEKRRNFALGTLAHELFHHVTYQVYENAFRPYERHDLKRKEKFEEILEATRPLKYEDRLIESVYREGAVKENNHGELIARVPDILLANRDNMSYINECRVKFAALFNYYENEVMRDLREIVPTVEAREKVREFNEWFNVVAEIHAVYNHDAASLELDKSEEEKEETFLKDLMHRINVVFSYHPRRKLKKIYKEASRRKLLTVFVKSSFGKKNNFKKVMFKIDALNPSVLLIIDCDDVRGLADFDRILDRSGFEKIVVVIDKKHEIKFKQLEFFEEWTVI